MPLSAKAVLTIQEVANSPTFIASPQLLETTAWRSFPPFMHCLVLKPKTNDDPVTLAPIEWIGELQPDGFRLLADGGYNDRFTYQFATAKATANVGRPLYPGFHDVWNGVEEAVRRIQGSISTPDAERLGNTILQFGALRIRHALFAPRVSANKELRCGN